MQDKAEQRRILSEKRRQVAARAMKEASTLIARRAFRHIDWSHIRTVHCYRASTMLREIDPEPLLELLAALPNPPKVTFVEQRRDAVPPNELFDVIIVPVVGFDTENYRIGQGSGWYDKFLAKQPQAITIGLAYDWAKVAFTHELHDEQLTHIIHN